MVKIVLPCNKNFIPSRSYSFKSWGKRVVWIFMEQEGSLGFEYRKLNKL